MEEGGYRASGPHASTDVLAPIVGANVALLVLWEIASFFMIAQLGPASLVRAEEVVQKFLSSYSSGDAGATSMSYTLLNWMIYFTAYGSLLPAAYFAFLLGWSYTKLWAQSKRRLAACFGLIFAIPACIFLCIFVMSLGSPSNSLSQREATVPRAELRAVRQQVGATFLSLVSVVAASLGSVPTIVVLAGKGRMRSRRDYLKFCSTHPMLLQAYPDMEELQNVARKCLAARSGHELRYMQ